MVRTIPSVSKVYRQKMTPGKWMWEKAIKCSSKETDREPGSGENRPQHRVDRLKKLQRKIAELEKQGREVSTEDMTKLHDLKSTEQEPVAFSKLGCYWMPWALLGALDVLSVPALPVCWLGRIPGRQKEHECSP